VSRRWLLALAAIAAIVALRFSGLADWLSLDALRANRGALAAWVAANPLLAPAAYVALYVAVVAFSLPGATAMTLAGGFLLGAALGGTLAVVSATLGAGALFLFASRVTGEGGLARFGERGAKLAEGLRRESFTYLLVLRLVPLFPFVLVNLVPALVGMRLAPFMAATFLGVIPGTAVFALAGAGLGRALDGDGPIRVLTPEVVLALCGLAATALRAIPLRRWLARR
jgi:uncharacterized membrane protein YdjX (TVP38/TMEM64 family)